MGATECLDMVEYMYRGVPASSECDVCNVFMHRSGSGHAATSATR
jgi:hypothetical protein